MSRDSTPLLGQVASASLGAISGDTACNGKLTGSGREAFLVPAPIIRVEGPATRFADEFVHCLEPSRGRPFFNSIVRLVGFPASTVTVCSVGPVKDWIATSL